MLVDLEHSISDLWQFICALYPHWRSFVTGSCLSILVQVFLNLERPAEQSGRRGAYATCVAHLTRLNKVQTYLALAVAGIIFASYSAWIEKRNMLADEHGARERAGAEYRNAEEKYRRTINDLQKQPPTANPSNAARRPRLTITRPGTDDAEVERQTAVSINARNVPPQLYLWLILRAPKGDDFPWIRCKAVNACESQIPNPFPGGDWDSREKIFIGAEDDLKHGNLRYTLRLVVVDKADNDRLAGIKPGDPATVTNPIAEFRRTVLRVK